MCTVDEGASSAALHNGQSRQASEHRHVAEPAISFAASVCHLLQGFSAIVFGQVH